MVVALVIITRSLDAETRIEVNFKEIEDNTIYVESFPPEVTSENLVCIFKRAGNVRYIKLPRFKDGQVKGFCFIEYSS